jgi:hypothetical protein
MPTAAASKPAYLSYEARQTLARRAERAAVVAAEKAKFDAERARVAAQTKAAVALEMARFKQFEARYGVVKMHVLADASGKAWTHRSLGVLQKFIADRNRTLSSPAYRSIQATYKSASRGTPALDRLRARMQAEDDAYWGDDDD